MAISAPKGLLKLVALELFSESSLSGAELQEQIRRNSAEAWRPGPGSIYFMLDKLRKEGLVVELPKRGGTVRRFVISAKGKAELERQRKEMGAQVKKQLEILAYACDQAKDQEFARRIRTLTT